MTVKELIEFLQGLPEESQVVFKPENSDYVEDFTITARRKMIRSMFGNDFEAHVIYGEQAGRIT